VSVTVYTVPNCTGCTATKRWLDKRGVGYETVDLSADTVSRERLAGLGFTSAPVVEVDDLAGQERWSGFRPDLLKAMFV
jgi:glutaredoxin-like protein NrdH